MKVESTELDGVLLVEPSGFGDSRGYFAETFQASRYANAGIGDAFVQDNVSFSRRGVLRGLHLQHPNAQGKLVYVLMGSVFDVAVDVRIGSPNFGRWVGRELNAENRWQHYLPPGFAHGFCVTSDTALFVYKCTDYYNPESELSIVWDDPEIGIQWPLEAPVLSDKDAAASRLGKIDPALLPRFQDASPCPPGT